MSSELASLSQLIVSGVNAIEAACDGAPLPSLDQPSLPEILNDPKFAKSANVVIAAASRLIASLQSPFLATADMCGGMFTSATINIVVEANVTEALKQAGPEGMHIRDLGERVNVEPVRLGRCLRYLCLRHIYREVAPDVFANNRMSMAFDTGKTFEEVKDRGPHRYENTKGIAALVGHGTDEGLKGSTLLSKVVLETKESGYTSDSYRPPLMQSVGFDGLFFEWLEQPDNAKRLHRFGAGMKSFANMFPAKLVLTSFDWSSLPKNSIVVDVGGGVGAVTFALAKNFPNLRFIVQDRPVAIVDGKKFWNTEFPEAITTGLVQLREHDFFTPQSVRDASVFFLRFILHDWSDVESKKIIGQLRASAMPTTKLILFEHIVPYLCPLNTQGPSTNAIPGSEDVVLPEVLRGNPGPALGPLNMMDMMMMNICDGLERTIGQWSELLGSAGWKIESVQRGTMCAIVCTPV